jgi:hypothetical protein
VAYIHETSFVILKVYGPMDFVQPFLPHKHDNIFPATWPTCSSLKRTRPSYLKHSHSSRLCRFPEQIHMNISCISKIIAQILGCRSCWNCSCNELVAIVMQSGKFARCSDWLYNQSDVSKLSSSYSLETALTMKFWIELGVVQVNMPWLLAQQGPAGVVN